ncbi:MAG: acyltransferase [Bacteroidales bacterium]|nr:acyltransferase [Bacteroidales bacterium]
MTKEDFKDIAPFEDSEFKENMAQLVKEPGFEYAVKYVMPKVDYEQFVNQLLSLDTKDSFHSKVMSPFLEMLAEKTTAGITADGLEECLAFGTATYISNHRDIVLDATFLNLCLLRNGCRTGEIALGDNLLIFDWIERLVKLNKGFIVKRNLRLTKAFEAAKQLSAYIHYCHSDKHESVWIAQREGRAKDSNDRTQEAVIKMLALTGGDSVIDSLKAINIAPTTISYEYDPNDYLKATEFLSKRRDPEFVKCKNDDLLSMETGLLGFKGRIHYHVSRPINDTLETLRHITDKNELFSTICAHIDNLIHRGYYIFPINYICYDRLNGTSQFADRYTPEEVEAVDRYFKGQLEKVRLENITDEEYKFMLDLMVTMYANPLINKLKAEQ